MMAANETLVDTVGNVLTWNVWFDDIIFFWKTVLSFCVFRQFFQYYIRFIYLHDPYVEWSIQTSAYITIRNELSKTLRLTTFFYQKVAHSANYVSATYVPI